MKEKTMLLTFDIERLGLSSYGLKLKENERYSLSLKGFKNILNILEKNKVKATFFVTADAAVKYEYLLKNVSKKHEIASHGLNHKDNHIILSEKEALTRIKQSKDILEKITGKRIYGFRAPRFQFKNYGLLKKIGLKYDSSLNPTYIPGSYNNFFKKRKKFIVNGVYEVPSSVTPILGMPLFWLCFRNLGLKYAKLCTDLCFLDNDYAMTIFHPWEFISLDKFKLPFYIKRNSGKNIEKMLDSYIKWCLRKGHKFKTIKEYLRL